MQPYTGHLVDTSAVSADSLKQFKQTGYEPVPKELELAASKKLNGQKEATVSLTSGGKLSRWASKQRKAKRKMAQDSRRKNRKAG